MKKPATASAIKTPGYTTNRTHIATTLPTVLAVAEMGASFFLCLKLNRVRRNLSGNCAFGTDERPMILGDANRPSVEKERVGLKSVGFPRGRIVR